MALCAEPARQLCLQRGDLLLGQAKGAQLVLGVAGQGLERHLLFNDVLSLAKHPLLSLSLSLRRLALTRNVGRMLDSPTERRNTASASTSLAFSLGVGVSLGGICGIQKNKKQKTTLGRL